MGLYKKRKVWWFIKQYQGRRIEESLGTENKRLAEKFYAEKLTRILDGSYFQVSARDKTLQELIARYESEYTEHKSYYSKARDKSIFKSLKEFFGENCALADIECVVGGYEQWRRSKGKNPATILKELGVLRRMFNVARKQWKWKFVNPVSEIELPKAGKERVRYLFPDEYKKLLEALDEIEIRWLKPVVLVALDTGLRLSNLCNLVWPEVNLFGRMITIDAEKMKNDDYIGIPLSDRAYMTLRELQTVKCVSGNVFHDEGQPLYDRKVQRAFKMALEKAEITNFRFHDLRHHFCSELRQRGVDLHTIAALASHKDLRMTKRYAHLNVDNLKGAIAVLNSTTILRPQEEKEAGVVV